MTYLLRAGVACAAFVAVAASADTIRITYDVPIYNPFPSAPALNFSTDGGAHWHGAYVGRFQSTVQSTTGGLTVADLVDDPNDLFSYCYDLAQYIAPGATYEYTVNYSGPTARTLDFLGAVNYVLNGNSNTWSDPYAWLHPTTSSMSAAIQLGIWESLYDTAAWNLSGGNLRISGMSASVLADWNKLLAAVLNPSVADLPSGKAMTIVSPTNQDQIIGLREPERQDVPEPGTLVLGALGALAALAMGKKKIA